MKRRTYLTGLGAGAAVALAGCADSTVDDDTLVVSTYTSFLDAPSTAPGAWLKSEFESEFDRDLVWQSPPGEINHFIERENNDQAIDTDVYLGVNTDELVRADRELGDRTLFTEAPDVEGAERIRDAVAIDDPEGRALTFDTGFICPVYDGTQIEAPETFEELRQPEFASELLAQDPTSSQTGLAFMLHTINTLGEDGDEWLEFWSDLDDGGATILGSWNAAYDAWPEEAPMVVSYSTDQVFADRFDANLEEHQVRFLNDQAYANPEGMAMFADGNEAAAREFMEFILRPEIQGEIAQRNVVFPAVENAELPADYDELAFEPSEPVTLGYEALSGSLEGWLEDWEREILG